MHLHRRNFEKTEIHFFSKKIELQIFATRLGLMHTLPTFSISSADSRQYYHARWEFVHVRKSIFKKIGFQHVHVAKSNLQEIKVQIFANLPCSLAKPALSRVWRTGRFAEPPASLAGRRQVLKYHCCQHAPREKHSALQCSMLQSERKGLLQKENQSMITAAMVVNVLSKVSRMKTIVTIGTIAVVPITTTCCAERSSHDAHQI